MTRMIEEQQHQARIERLEAEMHAPEDAQHRHRIRVLEREVDQMRMERLHAEAAYHSKHWF